MAGKTLTLLELYLLKKNPQPEKIKIISYYLMHDINVQKYKTGLFSKTCENILFAALLYFWITFDVNP